MSDDYEIKFGVLHPDGSVTNAKVIKRSAIMRCPHAILAPQHYRDDGSCRCNDPDHFDMYDWGYRWKDGAWR